MKIYSRGMRVLPLVLILSTILLGCGQNSESVVSTSHTSTNDSEKSGLAKPHTAQSLQLAGVSVDGPLAVPPSVPSAPLPGGNGPPLITVAIPGGGDGSLQIDRNQQSNRELLRDYQDQLLEEVGHLEKIDGRQLAADNVRVLENKYKNDSVGLRKLLLAKLRQSTAKRSVQASASNEKTEHDHVH